MSEKLLNGRYHFIKKLGEGAYGCVYLCEDALNDRRPVAVKKQKATFHDAHEGYSFSLLREVNILQELGTGEHKHPSTPELVEVFQLKDGSVCFVTEFLHGSLLGLL